MQFTSVEVALHNSQESAWIIVDGDIFDVTEFAASHPGGSAILLSKAGCDATEEFHAFHDRQSLVKLLAGMRVGVLAQQDEEDTQEFIGWVPGHQWDGGERGIDCSISASQFRSCIRSNIDFRSMDLIIFPYFPNLNHARDE